ncbi:TPA: hypothetical protein ACOECQ_000819 [Stenotrophomonas maltophilia]
MANANTDVTLQGVHDAVERAIRARFPGFRTVEFYRSEEDERELATPACLLEMTELEPTQESDGGSGKLPALLRFEARIIMQARDDGALMELRKAAAAMLVWLHQLGRFPGIPGDRIIAMGAEPDDWRPAHGGFRGWLVEFGVPCLLGIDAWAGENDGPAPRAFYSFAPRIGATHEGDYIEAGE